MMLAFIIPKKKQVENINIYLESLIDELKVLWKGMHVVNISKPIGIFDLSIYLLKVISFNRNIYN